MTQQILLPPSRRVQAGHWNSQKLPGSSHAQIILDTNGQAWVVKSINSPQGHVSGIQASFNDYLAGRLAELTGINVARVGLMEIDDEFLTDYYPDLTRPDHGAFTAGQHFACEFHQGCSTLKDFGIRSMMAVLQGRCTAPQTVNGIAAFDSVTSNWDRASTLGQTLSENLDNLLFQPTGTGTGLQPLMIDNGYCFAARWDNQQPPVAPFSVGGWPEALLGMFHTLTRLGWYSQQALQQSVNDLSRVTLRSLNEIVDEIPGAWKRFTDPAGIDKMLLYLLQRMATYDGVVQRQFTPVHALVLAG